MNPYTEPHLERSALVTIDTQNDFSLDNAPAQISGTMDIIPNMAKLLDTYRKKELLIIHLVRLYKKDGSNADLCRKKLIESGHSIVAPDSDGAELVSRLKPDPDVRLKADLLLAGKAQNIGSREYVFYKPRWGAFYGTDLEAFLRKRYINTLVFTGCNFPNCPRTSIYQASERDFCIVFVKDAVSKGYDRGVKELENIGVSVLTAQQVSGRLGQ